MKTIRLDLHNHTSYCNHATGTISQYIKRAEILGIDIYGFSCHSPMNFDEKYRMSLEIMPTYIKQVREIRSSIEILCGMEVDFILNKEHLISKEILQAPLDYLIGSIHFLDNWGFDNPEFLSMWSKKDLTKVWEEYLDSLYALCETKIFHIIGHLDLLKVFGNHMPHSLESKLLKVLENIKKHDLVVEINQAGLRKKVAQLYPSIKILKILKEMDIDITFGSDAHSISQVGFGYSYALMTAKQIGFKQQCVFRNKEKFYIDL